MDKRGYVGRVDSSVKAENLYGMAMPFTLAEYRSRVAKVKEEMARQKIDLLYCSAPESLFYLSGYESYWYKAQCPREWPPLSGMAIRQDVENFIFFDVDEEEGLARNYTVATDIRIYEEGPAISEIEFIMKNLKAEGWLKGTVALEKWSYRPNPAISQIIQAALEKEGCRVVDGSDIVREIRVIKSPQEMAYTRTAARIADIGMKAAVEHIMPGMTELDLRAEIDYACAKAGGETPGLPTLVRGGSQPHVGGHVETSRRAIMPGTVVVDLCAVYHRYHADLARTLSLGEPDTDVANRMDLSAKAWSVLSKTIKPNNRVSDLNKALEDYYRKAGIWEYKSWVGGYELGIAFPPDWIGIFTYDPEVDSGDRILPPGTIINYESNFHLPKGAGSSIIDTIAIEEDSVEILSKIPRDLIVVEA